MKGICPNCEKETELEHVRAREVVEVRGEPIEVDAEYYRCMECGEDFENTRGPDSLEYACQEYLRRHETSQVEAPWNEDPDFINKAGVKWWVDVSTTLYAIKEDENGIKLDVVCYFVEKPNGYRTRILVNKRERTYLYENPSLEGISMYIDALKFLKKMT